MAIDLEYPTVNEDGSSSPRQTATVVRLLMDGKNNGKGEVALAAGTQTVIVDQRIGPESVIVLAAMSAAAGAIGGHWWAMGQGQATLNHAAAVGGELYCYAIIG